MRAFGLGNCVVTLTLSKNERRCESLLNRKQKEEIVKELHEKLLGVKCAVITDFRGLDVSAMNTLRNELRAASVEYRVAKNSLLRLSSQDTDLSCLKDQLAGPSALALSKEDPVAPARVLVKFAKENPALKIKAGALDGKLLDIDAINALAELPSREVMLSMLLSAMNGVPTGFVVVLGGVIRNLLGVLSALRDQRERAA